MSTSYRMVVHCDETRGGDCSGFVEYASPDRLHLWRLADGHPHESGWLRGYRAGSTYDVCPACRPAVEREQEAAVGGGKESA